ncbi:hypothetical protein [Acinetobacter haemolyticus]|uniref:hypothetical protein n=1 Tax=Acinetobacter haemolyticus TaxID=29430 RepID=UPI00148F3A5C|nr:hypothetical protein [Acinetobacter haemolyticus]
MRKRNDDWLWIVGFIVCVVLAVAVNTWNTTQVCKNQDVYWVNGTQHTCTLFK